MRSLSTRSGRQPISDGQALSAAGAGFPRGLAILSEDVQPTAATLPQATSCRLLARACDLGSLLARSLADLTYFLAALLTRRSSVVLLKAPHLKLFFL